MYECHVKCDFSARCDVVLHHAPLSINVSVFAFFTSRLPPLPALPMPAVFSTAVVLAVLARAAQVTHAAEGYTARASGTCESHAESSGSEARAETRRVDTFEECEAGAQSLGWKDKTAREVDWGDVPPGCFKDGAGLLYFNTQLSSSVPCSASNTCLCTFTYYESCEEIEGNSPNAHTPCSCGFTNCLSANTTGVYCSKALNACSVDGRFKVFETRTSGGCTDVSGGAWVGSQEECEKLAPQVGFKGTSAELISPGDRRAPRGCSEYSFNFLHFNNDKSSTAPCSTTRTCMCSLVGRACKITDGSAPNSAASSGHDDDPPCICGDAVCTSSGDGKGTGLVCNMASNKKCSRPDWPNCEISDGSAPNRASCRCGTRDCESTGTTGMHCYEKENKCRKYSLCKITDGASANDASCSCGSVNCESTTADLHCFENKSSCRKFGVCEITNGTSPNDASCGCGSTDCESKSTTGLHCFENENKCRKFGVCLISDGSAPNGDGSTPCLCGETTCSRSTGMHCYATNNECLTFAHAAKGFSRRTSGGCTDESGLWAWVQSQAECEGGAHGLRWPDTSVRSVESISSPRGCFISLSPVISLDINSDTSSTTPCSISQTCMCSLIAPACEVTDGSVPNDPIHTPCICGRAVCTKNEVDRKGTGTVCRAATSTCSQSNECPVLDGSSENRIICTCGLFECQNSNTTGMFCTAEHSRCSKLQACAITDGTSVNSDVACTCGASTCESPETTGMYCMAGLSQCS